MWLNEPIKMDRGSHPEVFLGKSVLKICSKFTGEHPCRSVIKLLYIGTPMESCFWSLNVWKLDSNMYVKAWQKVLAHVKIIHQI